MHPVFRLPHKMNNSFLGIIVKRFFGQDTIPQVGKYRYYRRDLLESILHRRLLPGEVILHMSCMEKVVELLNE